MKDILDYIEQQKQNYAQIPFFDFLRDETIEPLQKLAFAPCAAPFVMGFGELNKSFLRDQNSTDPLQKIINHHTQQDAHHWVWFLEDIEKLGFNPQLQFRDTLKSLWSDEAAATRKLVYELYRLTYQCSPLQKLVVIETIEATGNVFLEVTAPFVKALETSQNQRYRYFGSHHLTVETGHTYCSTEAQDYIANLEVSDADCQDMLKIVDRVFAAFIDFNHELMAYAQNHPIDVENQQQSHPLGSCLCDAGLLTLEQLDQALLEQGSQTLSLGEIVTNHGWVNQQTVDYMITHVIGLQQKQQAHPVKSLAGLN